MNNPNIKQRITETLNQLSPEKLVLVEKAVQEIIANLPSKQSGKISSQATHGNDILAELRNSDFIGCFSDDSDLAENSEKIAHKILSKNQSNE